MAFQFPINPTVGDQITNPSSSIVYVWNGTAWTPNPLTSAFALSASYAENAGTIFVSDTAPINANTSSLWLNSTNMGLYVNYADIDGTQWVATSTPGPVITASFAQTASRATSASFAQTAQSSSVSTYATRAGIMISEPVTITATTTNPTKGSPLTVDRVILTDDGSGTCTLLLNYYQVNGGTGGNGDYLFTLPGGYQFDSSFHATNQIVGNPGMAGVEAWIMGSGGKLVFQPSLMAAAYAIVWDATRFRIVMGSEILFGSNTDYRRPIGSGFFTMGSGGIGYSMGFSFKKV